MKYWIFWALWVFGSSVFAEELGKEFPRAQDIEFQKYHVNRDGLAAEQVYMWAMPNKGFALIEGDVIPDDISFALNGTYFDREGRPVGLIRLNDQEQDAKGGEKLSALVSFNRGEIKIMQRGDEIAGESVFYAGPFVVDPGQQMGIRKNLRQRFNRNIMALLDDGRVAVFHFRNVDLWEAARFLMDFEPKVERAVNLDGGPSAMVYSAEFTQKVRVQLPTIIIRHSLEQQQSK